MTQTFEPYYTSDGPSQQRLWRFQNGLGASVVKRNDALEMAVIKPTGDKSFWLHYKTPFGPPKAGLTEDQVQQFISEIATYPSELAKAGQEAKS